MLQGIGTERVSSGVIVGKNKDMMIVSEEKTDPSDDLDEHIHHTSGQTLDSKIVGIARGEGNLDQLLGDQEISTSPSDRRLQSVRLSQAVPRSPTSGPRRQRSASMNARNCKMQASPENNSTCVRI